ncbi:MAG: serine hydrolase domain-containing protein [Steroidobacteraceae bacterium]
MNRRELLSLGAEIAAGVSAGAFLLSEVRADAQSRYAPAFALLDRFVEQYLREMNAPALTLALADAGGVQRVCAYGLDDLARRVPLNVDELFHIGSITKSFLGLCLLQLRDEGKLDLHRPIGDYLPWLRFDPTSQKPITAHDLLTHSAALPDGPLFPADPAFRHRATAAPGTFFHYCNMGYEALGVLLSQLDGRPLAECFRARILAPLGMTATEPAITLDVFERIATSYQASYNDRPFPRLGKLSQSPPIATSAASGCIASTARDMGAYVTMLINRGAAPSGRVASQAAFALFAQPHMAAEHFGPGASYGYGIATDKLDGHTRLRHTGGMISFASALEIDVDAGVGVFASINAMQGFRPRPVAEYALRLMRACREGVSLPAVPAHRPSLYVESAGDYAGQYAGSGGRALTVVADGNRLFLVHKDVRVPLEPAIEPDDAFIVPHPDFAHYPLLFGRAGAGTKGAAVEVGWGEEWFVTAHYSGPGDFKIPAEWHRYPGHYRNEDAWIGSNRIDVRKGKLWLNGTVPLEPAADGRFYLRDEPESPEWVGFSDFANGKAMRMRLSGADLARV